MSLSMLGLKNDRFFFIKLPTADINFSLIKPSLLYVPMSINCLIHKCISFVEEFVKVGTLEAML